MYTVLSQGEAKEQGHVERVHSQGVPVNTFTQLEVDQGLITYVHRGGEPGSNTRLALQVRNKVFHLQDATLSRRGTEASVILFKSLECSSFTGC